MPDEVRFIWPWEWRSGKILYLLTRYGAMIDATIFHVFWFDPNLDAKSCELLFNIGCWFLHGGIVVAHWIIIMRTYAIWSQSKIILVVLCVLVLGTDIPTFFILHQLLEHLKWAKSPFPTVARCFVTVPPNKLYINFTMIMIVELVIVILTVWKAINQRKLRHSNNLLGVLYRDGILFFMCLFAISLANFALQIDSNLPPLYIFLLPELQRILHSVLTSRIILHLREFTLRTPKYETVAISTTIAYREKTSGMSDLDFNTEGGLGGLRDHDDDG